MWDYVREQRRARPPALREGLHLDRLRPVHPSDRRGRADARRPLVVGDGCAQGVRDALLDRDRRVRARAACDPRVEARRMSSVAVKAEEREVALGEVQAVLAAARDDGYRARLTALVASVEEGELAGEEAAELERVLELGLQAGRIRARLRARRRAGGTPALPSPPRRRRAGRDGALGLRGARDARTAARSSRSGSRRSGPGCTGSRSSPAVPRSRSGSTAAASSSPRSESDVEQKRHYVACVDLEGRSVLVVGAGRVAHEKVPACSTAARTSPSSRRRSHPRWRRCRSTRCAAVPALRPRRPLPRGRRDRRPGRQRARLR